jgi:hypothetical protein
MSTTIFFDILGVVIGVVFIFLLLSIITSWIQEFIATTLGRFRSKELANIFQMMLDPDAEKLDGIKELDKIWKEGGDGDAVKQLNENALKAVYDHPVIRSLYKPGKLPSYVSSRDFAVALFDLLSKAGTDQKTSVEITLDNINNGIDKIGNVTLKERLKSLANSAGVVEDKIEDELVAFRENVYHWFDASMDRGSGWYKRKAQRWAIAIGILVAVFINADTIAISQTLWQNSALRDSINVTAESFITEGEAAQAREAQTQLNELGLPLGWSFKIQAQDTPQDPRNFPNTAGGWILKSLGLLITGIAISQGSSIWFDILGKLINLRGSGGKPETGTETGEGSESPSVRLEIESSSKENPSRATGGTNG